MCAQILISGKSLRVIFSVTTETTFKSAPPRDGGRGGAERRVRMVTRARCAGDESDAFLSGESCLSCAAQSSASILPERTPLMRAAEEIRVEQLLPRFLRDVRSYAERIVGAEDALRIVAVSPLVRACTVAVAA